MEQFRAIFCRKQLHFYPSQANFILIDFGTSGDEVFQFLIERGFIVRSGNALGFPTAVRVTVGSKEENSELIEMMEQYVKQKASITNRIMGMQKRR